MAELKGTPITRGGGKLIRVGWRGVGYSVDRSIQTKYRIWKAVLLLLALAVGVGTALGAGFVFFNFAAPLIAKIAPFISNYPQVWWLLIYGSTLVFGGLIYWHIRAKVGEGLVRGQTPLDEGRSVLEQRQRRSLKRKRERFLLLVGLALVWFVPIEIVFSMQLFLSGIMVFLLVEGIYFQIKTPPKA
ncbi:hypothetical protein [Kordiimonas aquimaris]|uniref:hypothetical protein n=1 Tax=Kordiimonas aquimaris TaxID=707591 RepID=UPI0021D380CF|nr:hypothetical protein [Kordiimonas aquimaris]